MSSSSSISLRFCVGGSELSVSGAELCDGFSSELCVGFGSELCAGSCSGGDDTVAVVFRFFAAEWGPDS